VKIDVSFTKWLSGVISAVSSGILTGLAAIAVIKEPTVKQIAIIIAMPMAVNFFSYLKINPVPME
jgi:hypothetical protein